MKTIDEIAAEIRLQRERMDQHIRELAAQGTAEEILNKLRELRTRGETTAPGDKQGQR